MPFRDIKSEVRNVKNVLTSEVKCDYKYAVYSWVTGTAEIITGNPWSIGSFKVKDIR